MTEHAVIFAAQSLVGVLTEVDDGASRPAVVFLNAGVLHRVGPNGLYVRIARELARQGLASLRFDRSGIGDSPPRVDGLTLHAAALSDVRDALDFAAAKLRASSFILIGLCSGADLAFSTALADKRVVGAVLIDGLPYQTVRSRLHHFASRLRRRGAWRSLLARDGPVWRRLRRTQRATRPVAALRRRDVPSKEDAARGLRELAQRGVRLLLVYTPGRECTYPRQFWDMFPEARPDQVDVAYCSDADHVFTLRANQDLLVRTIDQWMRRFQ